MASEDRNTSEYKFNCKQCGNCCRAGFEIVIQKEDVEKWIKGGNFDFYRFVQIDSKCISKTGLAGYHVEEVNTLEILKKNYNGRYYKKKLDQLKKFILKKHTFLGNGLPLPVYTFIPDLGRTPILVPKTLKILLKGLEWGLVYVIKFEGSGYCPFLKNNLCSIHEIKPNVCRRFPFNENGELKIDEYFLNICQGLTKNSSK